MAGHVRRRLGVQCNTVSMHDILHGPGFSCRKPRHPKSASKHRKEAFKKKARETVRDGPGHRADALDGASHTVGWDAKGSRCPRGRPATALAALSRRRFHPLRALLGDASGCRLCDRPNGDIPTGLPGHLRHKYGRIIVTLDNSACHKPKEAV